MVPNAGAFAEARIIAELARDAEDSGWDGFFVWDTIEHEGKPVVDPWVALAASATTTSRIRLGPMVVSTARRRPWKLAREAVTLDRLSRGRLVLGLGAGYRDVGFTAFGEDPTPAVKFAKLDETIALLDAFFAGRPIRHRGRIYTVNSTAFLPRPSRGTIPLWLALSGTTERELARAARVDGVLGAVDIGGAPKLLRYVRAHRDRPGPFDLVIGVHERRIPREALRFVKEAAHVGATWIRYEVGSIFDTVDELGPSRRFIRRGPPGRES